MAANNSSIINLPMVLQNLLVAANSLPLVLIGNDMWILPQNVSIIARKDLYVSLLPSC